MGLLPFPEPRVQIIDPATGKFAKHGREYFERLHHNSGGTSDDYVRPDDFEGTDSVRCQAAVNFAADEGRILHWGHRAYEIGPPVKVPNRLDGGALPNVYWLSQGAQLIKIDDADNRAVIFHENFADNLDVGFADPFYLLGEMLIDGAGIARDGFVWPYGAGYIRGRLSIKSTTRYGYWHTRELDNGSPITDVYSNAFDYAQMYVWDCGEYGIYIPGAADGILDGAAFLNGRENIWASIPGGRFRIATYGVKDGSAFTPDACAHFEGMQQTWLDQSQFGSDGLNKPSVRFNVAGGIPIVRNVTFQGGDCLVTFPDSSYYDVAFIMHSYFQEESGGVSPGPSRITIEGPDAGTVYSSHNLFENNAPDNGYHWDDIAVGAITAHDDYHKGYDMMANGVQTPGAASPT